ncbi:GNAT family N-acetyltransferase [Thalassomonas viridans]|uniref:GNAT family N-acetyltransferase n=1 Tax=Thalassomonas viridans TaxID=137584 RepID=A0AAE9Z0X6_9GAMM|nr:GNAT family N-acetyltransferase [Thalassomonas viridans]WDE03197.1 GNAT family N-acetyltransferase [Thalassomonas viridans]
MSFKFVQAKDKDRAYLLDLRKLTMVEHLEQSGQFLTEQEHLDRLNDAYECSHIVFYQNEKIGTLKYREQDEELEIMQIQISPRYQGQGLGKKVLEQVLHQTDAETVKLTVLKDNPARHLYQRLGFTQTDEDEYEFHMQLCLTDRKQKQNIKAG